jgi:carbonic anhydrase
VAAALAARRGGSRDPSRIAALIDTIVPGLRNLPEGLSADDEMKQGVDANVRWSMRQILETPEGKKRLEEGELKIVGAVYEIQNGRVRFFD